MIGAREKALKRVPCIHYLIQLKDMDNTPVQALINLESEVNAIHPFFAKQLGLPIRPTDIRAQKIDGIMLDTNEMVVAAFSVMDKVNQVRFFEKTFLVANVSQVVVLGMLFLTLSSADVDYSGRELRWRTYTTEKALPTTRCVEFIRKKEFAAIVLDLEHETYVIHVAALCSTPLTSLKSIPLNIHPSRKPQISGLIAEEAHTKVLAKYLDFAEVFSLDLASELSKHNKINNHAIKLFKSY